MNIVVLGGGIDTAGNLPPHVIPRLQKAIELSKKDARSPIILSGHYSYLYKDTKPLQSEAQAMSKYLIDHGVDQTRLVLEDRSQDTISNAYFLKTLVFLPRQLTQAVVVTSEFQRERAKYIFDRVFGPGYSFSYIAVGESMQDSDREKLVQYQQELLQAIKKFLGPMKPGDHMYLADKFYTAPYYTKRQRPSWVADFVAKGTWGTEK